MTEPDDAELVRRHVSGDRRAFDVILSRYERRVWAVCLRMCGEHEDARDAMQETFLTAFRALGNFRGEAQLATWLHRVAVNASLDLLRKRGRQQAEPTDSLPEHPDRGVGPEEQAIGLQQSADVQAAIARLSPDYRAVVVLHDLQGLGYPEIAEVLDVPLGTVKSRLHRARIQLAGMLGHLRELTAVEPTDEDGTLR